MYYVSQLERRKNYKNTVSLTAQAVALQRLPTEDYALLTY